MSQFLTEEEFWRLFVSFEHTAFRLETRDNYAESVESEAFRRFLAGEPADDTWFMSYGQAVRSWVAVGKRIERVRVVSKPHSDYVRWSLQVARLNTQAGEDIRYLTRQRAAELELPAEDYWLFDSARAAFLRFGEGDERIGVELTDDPAVVVQCCKWRDRAWHYAVPFTEYAR